MPTTHVEPDSESLLQDIATTLWKARKIVVITGAGISTNSGIPDFRSENGLYSLIQAQFDAAAGKDGTRSNDDADESDLSSDSERPSKRRRISREEGGALFPKLFRQRPLLNGEQEKPASRAGQGIGLGTIEVALSDPLLEDATITARGGAGLYDGQQAQEEIVLVGVDGREHAPGLPATTAASGRDDSISGSKQAAPRPALTPLLSPRPSSGKSETDGADSDRVALVPNVHFISSPPSLSLEHSIGTSDREPAQTVLSSPLSSPPPYLSDPFQECPQPSSSPSLQSSSQDDTSSRSQSEESSSASTPLLTSQTSFASSSSRTSLPNLKGKDLFDAQIWSCPIKTSVFYTFATTLRQKVRAAEPTSSHHFVSALRDTRKLVRCYTQNIDQLEERVGLATSLELGAGSRYRFSARAGRNSGGSKGPVKEMEPLLDPDGETREPLGEDVSSSHLGMTDPSPGNADPGPGTDEKPIKPSCDPPLRDDQATATHAPTNPLPPSGPNRGVECVFLHGSLAELRCFVCGRNSPWEEKTRLADTMAGRQPTCPHCAGATAARQERGKRALGVGKLRPDIVLYGEEHPHAHLISPIIQHDLSLGPDMLLILGTSMRVHGLKVLVKEFAKAVHDRGGKVVFVNFTKPPESVWSDVIDFWIQWDCDAWVGDLRRRKPALFLPLGASLPEAENTKPAKVSRKSNGSEVVKRRNASQAALVEEKESSGPSNLPSTEEPDRLPVVGGEKDPRAMDLSRAPEDKVPPPRAPRPARVRKEPRFNPDAKRPASVRDDKFNGAYLVGKIGLELQRITGIPAFPGTSPLSAPKARPKAKRARKSAPAALESQDASIAQHRVPAGLVAEPMVSPPSAGQADSISAAVKNRKRKRTVTWKKIHGMETPVALDDALEVTLPPSPPPPALPGPARLLSLGRRGPPEPFPHHIMPSAKLPMLAIHTNTPSTHKLRPLEPPPMVFCNPFFLSDPLWRHFSYPCSPTAQLRREEQEAVTALSSLSGRI